MDVMNTVINALLAECGKQNMLDEYLKLSEASNTIKVVCNKLMMKYESKNEQKQRVEEFVTLKNIMKQKQEEKKK